MNSIIILLVLLSIVTLLHLGFLTRKLARFSVHWLLPESNNIEYPEFNPSTDRLRTLITLSLFFSPLFIFKAYRNLAIENIAINITVLVILTSVTCLSLYINKNKIWSKSFTTSTNKKNKKDDLITSIEEKFDNLKNSVSQNNVLITGHEKIFNNLKKNIVQNNLLITRNETKFDSLENHICKNKTLLTDNKRSIVNLSKNKNQISEKISHIKKDILKIESNVEQLKSNLLTKQQKIKEKENKSFKEYFITEEKFHKTMAALEENNFFHKKSEITPTNVSILAAKLEKLNFIIIDRQKYLCIALKEYFKTNKKVDPSILSRVLISFRDNSKNNTHDNIYKGFNYLDKLNQE